MPDLSPKQREVLAFIRRFFATQALPPTRGEIAQGLGLKNRQGVDQHLRALEDKGAIELIPGISRGIRLSAGLEAESAALAKRRTGRSTAPEVSSASLPASLPVLGRIAAGSPILAAGNIEEHVNVDPALFRPRAGFLLRVRGDSMKNADILDRDLLAVHPTAEARNGQIVIARIGDEATVKYFRRQGPVVRLEPANAAYEPIEIDLRKQELTIEGLAVGVIRTRIGKR